MTKKKSENFADNFKRLEEISNLMENEEIDIEEAISLYEEGMILSKKCYTILKNAELKITELKKNMELDIEENDSLLG